ncbi:MAG TPA: hypothetical protein VK588_04655, partial [Chitinophagaceae bacterium]|nr:hypothetical protein [Chitinophagaceae bacterium]
MSGKKVKNKTSVSSGDTEPVIKSIEGFVSIGKGLAELKEETMVWLLSILGAVMAYVVATFVIRKVYHPDIKSLLETARNVLISPESARPEPVEAMLFRVTVVVFTLGLLCFYVFFAKKQFVKDLSQKPIFMISSGLCVAFLVAMIYYDFAAQNPFVKDGGDVPQNSRDFVGFSNFDFYFDGIFLGNYLLLYTFILAPLISCLFFWGVKKYDWGNNQIIKRAVSVICLGVVFVIVLMCTFSFPYTFENKYDFNAVYYSMTQVYSGAPLFINGFTNTYGLYPEFLLPIFRIIGLSVLNFSLVMAILTGAAFAFNFYVLKRFTVNKFILLAGFLAVVFFPFLDFKFLTAFDSLFALFSIRYIIPSTLIFLSAIYFQKQSKVVYWLTFAVMGCFVLWNPEIGMVCYLTWVAVNTYHDFYTAEGKIALKKIGFHWLTALGIIVATAYAYKLIIYMAYGSFPDLSLLFGTIAVFGKV